MLNWKTDFTFILETSFPWVFQSSSEAKMVMALWRCPSTVHESSSFVVRVCCHPHFPSSIQNVAFLYWLLFTLFFLVLDTKVQCQCTLEKFSSVWSLLCFLVLWVYILQILLLQKRSILSIFHATGLSLIACTFHSLKSPPCSWDGLNMPGWVLIFSLFKKYVHCLGYFRCYIFWCGDVVHHVMCGQAHAACSSPHITSSVNPTCTSLKVFSSCSCSRLHPEA